MTLNHFLNPDSAILFSSVPRNPKTLNPGLGTGHLLWQPRGLRVPLRKVPLKGFQHSHSGMSGRGLGVSGFGGFGVSGVSGFWGVLGGLFRVYLRGKGASVEASGSGYGGLTLRD